MAAPFSCGANPHGLSACRHRHRSRTVILACARVDPAASRGAIRRLLRATRSGRLAAWTRAAKTS